MSTKSDRIRVSAFHNTGITLMFLQVEAKELQLLSSSEMSPIPIAIRRNGRIRKSKLHHPTTTAKRLLSAKNKKGRVLKDESRRKKKKIDGNGGNERADDCRQKLANKKKTRKTSISRVFTRVKFVHREETFRTIRIEGTSFCLDQTL